MDKNVDRGNRMQSRCRYSPDHATTNSDTTNSNLLMFLYFLYVVRIYENSVFVVLELVVGSGEEYKRIKIVVTLKKTWLGLMIGVQS